METSNQTAIKALNFNTPEEIKDKSEILSNEIRLERVIRKKALKKQLKIDLKDQSLNKKNVKEKYRNDLLQIKNQSNKQLLTIEIDYYDLFVEAVNEQDKIVKTKETKEAKRLRKEQIKKIKQGTKEAVIKQKQASCETEQAKDLVKSNIKTLKKNASLEIKDLKKQVLFNPIQRFFMFWGRGLFNLGKWFRKIWRVIKANHPNIAQFLVFFILSNGITVLQLAMMPALKALLNQTDLIDIALQFGQVGKKISGDPYFMFDYPAGPIIDGIGGGLAYFLSVQITLAIAQIINFFTQRSITFKSNSNPWIAAIWYFIAYVAITFVAAAAQGLYKTPIYNLLMNTWSLGQTGELIADFVTMIINSAISFWVFFPIFKIIFKQKKTEETIK